LDVSARLGVAVAAMAARTSAGDANRVIERVIGYPPVA
jgi:hypothetical protein